MKTKVRISLLYILSFIISVAPMLIYFFIHSDRYIKTLPEGIRLCFGGILIMFLIILKVLGKLHINSRFTFFIILFLLSYLLNSILSDILIFSFLAMLGEIFDSIISFIIKKIKEKEGIEKSAEATAEKVGQVLKKYYRGEDI